MEYIASEILLIDEAHIRIQHIDEGHTDTMQLTY